MTKEGQDVKVRSQEDTTRISYPVTPRKLPYHDCYRVVDQRQSECSWVLFVCHAVTKKMSVLKILKRYKDETRYALEHGDARQRCLIESLRVNRAFSSPFAGIYKGLVPIIYPNDLDSYLSHLDVHRDLIITGALSEMPDFKDLNAETEYGLVMTQLPEDSRLDYLLIDARSDDALLGHYRQLLVSKIVSMHKHQLLQLDHLGSGLMWGSEEQLQEKLAANLQFLQEALNRNKNSLFRDYGCWFREQQELLPRLLKASYFPYFDERVRKGCIRHCHGDLKAPNIWIAPHNSKNSAEVRDHVFLLDAIDFNPAFANIDILSDFAMLVVDVQVRMRSEKLAVSMIEDYLAATGQQDEAPRVALNYYLIEKAMVGAAVSVIDDGLASFSRTYLDAARVYAKRFADQVSQLVSLTV